MGLFGKSKDEKILDKAKRLQDAGKLDEAKAEYEKVAIKGNSFAYFMMGSICLDQAEKAKDKERYREAIRYLKESIRFGDSDPKSIEELIMWAEGKVWQIEMDEVGINAPASEKVEKIEEDGEDGEDIIVLTLDNGEELSCSVVGIFTGSNDKEYIALLPIEDNADDTVILMGYNDAEDTVEEIVDDAEYEIAAEAYKKMLDALDFDSLWEDADDFEPSF